MELARQCHEPQGARVRQHRDVFEGTGEIDTVYNSMVLASGWTNNRDEGKLAAVGIQDSTGATATADFETAKYGTGKSYSYVPSP